MTPIKRFKCNRCKEIFTDTQTMCWSFRTDRIVCVACSTAEAKEPPDKEDQENSE